MNVPNRLTSPSFKALALVALLGTLAALSCQATIRYWNGNVSQDWSEANNFQSNGDNLPGVPEPYDTLYLEAWAAREPLFNASGYAPVLDIYFSKNATLAAGGVLESLYFKLGQNASATLEMSGGSLSADNHLDVGGYNGGTATLNVSGGAISVGGFYLNLNGAASGASYVNLTGGTITQLGPLSINASHPAILNLAGGTLIMPASNLGNVNYWIDNGHNIVAYKGAGTVNVDTTTSPGNLILTGVQGPTVATRYWNGNLSQDWSNPNNFQSEGSNLPGVPEAGNSVYLPDWAVREPLLNQAGYAGLNDLHANKSLSLTNGAELNTAYFKLADSASATLTVRGGTLRATNHLDVGGYNGATALATMTGGALSVGGLQLNLNGDTALTAGGSQLYLNGGTITATSLGISESHPTLLNLAGGTLVLPNSQLDNVRFWMNDGAISAYGLAESTNRFSIDQSSSPGNLLITALYPGFEMGSFAQWNPLLLSNLNGSLDQAMAVVPAGLRVVANANYSFGSAVATNGDVYFSEMGSQRISKLSASSGLVSTVVANRPGVFGIAIDSAGNLFYAQDLGPGASKVIWRTPAGSEQTLLTNLTVPKQLSVDAAGNLYVVLEWGEIIKWTKSTGLVATLLKTPPVPQAMVVAPDGRIYFCTYARGGGTGTILTQGAVWVREVNGTIRPLAGGFGRGRGLALHPSGELYLAAEANVWDNGNSGLLVRIATNGTVTRVASGIDYPQFPSVGPDGKVYCTLARDNKLVCYDPLNSFAPQTVSTSGVSLSAEGASWQSSPGANYPFGLHLTNTNNPADTLNLSGFLKLNPGAAKVGLWWNVPVTNLNISLTQLTNSSGNTNSGAFRLPAASVDWAYGSVSVSVIPLREHKRCRWPMTHPGDAALEGPAPDFSEKPVSYLVYVSLASPPSLQVQRFSPSQVRLSWPAAATGYTLQRSSSLSAGYSSPGLSVSSEGSESASYDTPSTEARFYRLIK